MGIYLNPGNAGFRSVLKGTYVDKTEMIALINQTIGSGYKLNCISRPRRFGKSYAVKMLVAYYDKSCNSEELFRGLQIEKDPSYRSYLNQLNVISLDITGFVSKAVYENRDMFTVVSDVRESVLKELREAWPQVKKSSSLGKTLVNITEKTGLFQKM